MEKESNFGGEAKNQKNTERKKQEAAAEKIGHFTFKTNSSVFGFGERYKSYDDEGEFGSQKYSISVTANVVGGPFINIVERTYDGDKEEDINEKHIFSYGRDNMENLPDDLKEVVEKILKDTQSYIEAAQ